ncbi:hypothetical protein FrCorBMG51_18850 [Protofrankia coriariae]|uniref:Phosphoglycerate kinase n=1 Tax=Protofrankia coriariae TaxID=1562887 RepID=A0ABR5F0S5_9ACTN|nr:hypothetical protein FrCorBMG51_18850 [Protofrankia coriariae]
MSAGTSRASTRRSSACPVAPCASRYARVPPWLAWMRANERRMSSGGLSSRAGGSGVPSAESQLDIRWTVAAASSRRKYDVSAKSCAITSAGTPTRSRTRAMTRPVRSLPALQCTIAGSASGAANASTAAVRRAPRWSTM